MYTKRYDESTFCSCSAAAHEGTTPQAHSVYSPLREAFDCVDRAVDHCFMEGEWDIGKTLDVFRRALAERLEVKS